MISKKDFVEFCTCARENYRALSDLNHSVGGGIFETSLTSLVNKSAEIACLLMDFPKNWESLTEGFWEIIKNGYDEFIEVDNDGTQTPVRLSTWGQFYDYWKKIKENRE